LQISRDLIRDIVRSVSVELADADKRMQWVRFRMLM